jgi:CBS domain containing-hemolysin-like protein
VSRISFENPQRLTETVTKSMRKAIFIPESKPVDDLLQEMQLSSTHIALIIDEYGGVAGLVTMEDVIEELVGEISDEYDREVSDVEKLEDGKYLVNARYSLFELGELFDLELEYEDVDSVGGLVAKELGRLAKHGEVVTVSGLRFTVNRVEPRRKRLVSVLVERTSELADAESVFDSKENNEL